MPQNRNLSFENKVNVQLKTNSDRKLNFTKCTDYFENNKVSKAVPNRINSQNYATTSVQAFFTLLK